MTTRFEGILPAVLTPFTEAGELDVPALELLLERLFEAEIDGLYLCGQTGEGMAQTVEMRQLLLETAMRVTPQGKQVVTHVGATRMAEAVALTRHAATAGAHGISSLPPAGAYSLEEIRAYYAELASTTALPLLLYYFPETAPNLKSSDVAQLCALPGVAGVKFTSYDLHLIAPLDAQQAAVLNGRDEVLAAGLLMGARGGIGSFYNVVPELFVEVYRAARKKDWETARRVQDRINTLISIVLRFPMIPALKKMLTWSGIPCGEALRPRRSLTAQEERDLRAALTEAGFDPAGFLRTAAAAHR